MVRLQPDIIEYNPGDQAPIYDLIIGKQTLHNLGVTLDFKEKYHTNRWDPLAYEEYSQSAFQTYYYQGA